MSIWNVDSLHALMEERDKRYKEMFASSAEAVRVAKETADKWHENANKWREAMVERERTFLPRNLGYIASLLSVLALILAVADKFK